MPGSSTTTNDKQPSKYIVTAISPGYVVVYHGSISLLAVRLGRTSHTGFVGTRSMVSHIQAKTTSFPRCHKQYNDDDGLRNNNGVLLWYTDTNVTPCHYRHLGGGILHGIQSEYCDTAKESISVTATPRQHTT